VSKSIWCRFSKPLTLLVGGVLLSGCNTGEETIPMKKPDFLLEAPKQDAELKGKKPMPGSSAGMDPSKRPGQIK